MHHHARGLLMIAALLLAGCAGRTVERQQGTAMPILPRYAQRVGYVANWYQDLAVPPSQRVVSAKRLGELLLVREAPEPMLTAVSIRDGSIRWRTQPGDATEVFYDPARRGDRVFVPAETRLIVLDATNGQRLSATNLENVVKTTPLVIEDLLVFGGTKGLVFARNWQRPLRPWQFELPGRLSVRPIESEGQVLVVGSRGHYALLDGRSGEALWRGRTFGPISALPLADGRSVYIPSTDRTLYALDQATGQDLWKYRAEAPLSANPTRIGERVYLPVPGQALVAIDRASGKAIWRLAEPLEPVTQRGANLLLHGRRKLTLVRRDAGVVVSEARTRPLRTVVAGPDSSAILVTDDGHVQRINAAQ